MSSRLCIWIFERSGRGVSFVGMDGVRFWYGNGGWFLVGLGLYGIGVE
jgi:hypothetical protein